MFPKIHWHLNNARLQRQAEPADNFPAILHDYYEPMGMPDSWPDRPWIFAIMVASKNGVVAWKRSGSDDDPVLSILGMVEPYKKPATPERLTERIADKLLMRYLRTVGDMSIGAQTVREQEELVQTPQEVGTPKNPKDTEPELQPLYRALYELRLARGFSEHPKNIIYSPSGNFTKGEGESGRNLIASHPIFNTVGLTPIIVTTFEGEERVRRQRGTMPVIAHRKLDAAGLTEAHQELFTRFGVKHLDCEGGETILRELHKAGILDEVFVTYSDVEINESQHEGVLRIFDSEKENAELVAEGKVFPEGAFTFRRWRFNTR